jgi:hypothetical protein
LTTNTICHAKHFAHVGRHLAGDAHAPHGHEGVRIDGGADSCPFRGGRIRSQTIPCTVKRIDDAARAASLSSRLR